VSAPRDRLASLGAALRRRVHARSRARRHQLFMSIARPGPGDAVLDVGVTDLSGYGASLLEQLYPWPERITAGAEEQRAFLAELARVGRRVLFVATPSRSFSVDAHTLVPFAHWLPPRARDVVCARLGVGEWVRGRLRLVSAGELERLATLAGWPPHDIARQRLFGLTSVLVLHAGTGVGRP
jgi:hypothetical protein